MLRCFVKTASRWHSYRRKGNLGFSFFTRRAVWCWLSNLVNWQQCRSLPCPSQCSLCPESKDFSPGAEGARRQRRERQTYRGSPTPVCAESHYTIYAVFSLLYFTNLHCSARPPSLWLSHSHEGENYVFYLYFITFELFQLVPLPYQ